MSSPTPWHVEESAPWRIIDADGLLVTEVASPLLDPGPGVPTKDDENAKLICSAVNGTPVLQAMNSEHDMTTQELARSVWEWAEATFPHRNDSSMLLKLYEEVGELVRQPGHPDELADLFILLMDFAYRHKLDIKKMVLHKLFVNMKRRWKVDHLTGVMHHVPGSET